MCVYGVSVAHHPVLSTGGVVAASSSSSVTGGAVPSSTAAAGGCSSSSSNSASGDTVGFSGISATPPGGNCLIVICTQADAY